MGAVVAEISMSVDGYVAGPDPGLEQGLGRNGEKLHEWAFASRAWNESHGRQGGEPSPVDDEVIEEMQAAGATVIGRRMYSGGNGPWDEDPNADGWWGDEPPFHHPVFVLTHHPREPREMEGGTTFTFVTDGIGSAVEQARAAAGELRVTIGGGASAIQQALAAGLVDELRINVAPVVLGDGTPLFQPLEAPIELEQTRVTHSPAVTHLSYRVSG